MKKLEDIPKKEVFTVPEGYFDQLPGVIQARVAAQGRRRELVPVFSWKVAVPALVVVAAAIFWLAAPGEPADAESILASVETHDLVAYLNETDEVSVDDVLESVDFNELDMDEIEGAVYVPDLESGDLENLMNELD
jgi:hypothetical protein